VGALIVKIQAETASFRSDLGKVKSDLDGLKDKAGETGGGVASSFSHAGEGAGGLRTQIGLLDNAIRGAHAQAMADLIRKYSDTKIVMELLPIAATGAAFVVMAGLAYEGVKKIYEAIKTAKEETEKLKESQAGLSGTIATTATGLKDKFLEAGIAADNLNHNHLGAVKKELELIDDQSLTELEHTFESLASAADKSFAQLKAHWYEFGSGSEGAKHSLEAFQSQYEFMLKTGTDKGAAANKFLDEKIARERTILALQQQASNLEGKQGTYSDQAWANTLAYTAASNKLKAMGVGFSAKEIQSEQDLVDILQAQVSARDTIAKTATVKKHTVVEKSDNQDLTEEAALQKVAAAGVEHHAEALLKLARTKAEQTFASTKGGKKGDDVDAQLANQKTLIEALREYEIGSAAAQLAEKKAVYTADLKAYANNAAKKKELAAQWVNDQKAHDDAIVQANADAQKQIVAATREAANQKQAAADAAAKLAGVSKVLLAESDALANNLAEPLADLIVSLAG